MLAIWQDVECLFEGMLPPRCHFDRHAQRLVEHPTPSTVPFLQPRLPNGDPPSVDVSRALDVMEALRLRRSFVAGPD